MDKSNMNWDNNISTEEVFNRSFKIGYLIQSNQHLEFFQDLKDKVLSTYSVVAEFEYLGYNGDDIECNGQRLVYRKNKSSNFSLGKNVEMIEHNLSTRGGGSNKYPSVCYNGAKCTLKFISYGLPFVDKINGWSIKIIELTKIES